VLISIQRDLEDITAMEQKAAEETKQIERDLDSQLEDGDYLETRGNKHNRIY
jgi:hypothetical protein